jgi:hypothetical protein
MRIEEFIVGAFFGAGMGRLMAKDTILLEARDKVLRRLVIAPRYMEDLADHIRTGNDQIIAPDWKKAKLAEGIACPGCQAFWWLTAAQIITRPTRLLSRRGLIEHFAIWGAAAAITRSIP